MAFDGSLTKWPPTPFCFAAAKENLFVYLMVNKTYQKETGEYVSQIKWYRQKKFPNQPEIECCLHVPVHPVCLKKICAEVPDVKEGG